MKLSQAALAAIPDAIEAGAKRHSRLIAMLGGLAAVAVGATSMLRCRAMRATAQRRAAQRRNVVYLTGFPRQPDKLQPSPYVLAVETYLRLAKIPYVLRIVGNPSESPTGRFPYIELNGEVIADSEFIIKALNERFPGRLEALSPVERAQSVSLKRIIDCSARLHQIRYTLVDHTDKTVDLFAAMIPIPRFVLSFMTHRFTRPSFISMLNTHGEGDLVDAEYKALWLEDMQTVAHYLSQHDFAVGDRPSEADAVVFGWLYTWDGFAKYYPPTPPLTFIRENDAIQQYLKRILNVAFADADALLSTANSFEPEDFTTNSR